MPGLTRAASVLHTDLFEGTPARLWLGLGSLTAWQRIWPPSEALAEGPPSLARSIPFSLCLPASPGSRGRPAPHGLLGAGQAEG